MLERLQRLEEYVRLLEGLQGEDFSDPYRRGALERYLQLAAEASLDVGEMLIAREGLERPDTYRGVIRVLGDSGILEAGFAREFEGVAGLRNVLVHDYARVDPERLAGFLGRLDEFREYARAVAAWLAKRRGA